MPAAICEGGHVTHWRNQRGARLRDISCFDCGKKLYAATFSNGKYIRREATKQVRNKK